MLEVRTRAARSTAQWTASAPVDVVRERFLHEISQSARARVTMSASDVIEASVRGNAFSWGERITVRLTPTGNGTSVAVETRPAMPSTLFDWGEGERDIRLLHAAVLGVGGESSEHPPVNGAPARLGRTSRMAKPLGWFVVVVAVIALMFALFNLVVNTERVWSWLPLLVIMSLALVVTMDDLRRR
jgi:hypothetical protein